MIHTVKEKKILVFDSKFSNYHKIWMIVTVKMCYSDL